MVEQGFVVPALAYAAIENKAVSRDAGEPVRAVVGGAFARSEAEDLVRGAGAFQIEGEVRFHGNNAVLAAAELQRGVLSVPAIAPPTTPK